MQRLTPHRRAERMSAVTPYVNPPLRSHALTRPLRQGMYRPLGTGDVDVPAIVGHLRVHGYDGWYTLEQDTILGEEPKQHGPVEDVAASAECLRTVLRRTG
jgi:inosose dehydratase